jgi:hypothetical protein
MAASGDPQQPCHRDRSVGLALENSRSPPLAHRDNGESVDPVGDLATAPMIARRLARRC